MSDHPATILIVDDDPQILRLVQKMLGSRRVNVLVSPLPSDALRICEAQSIDLLISDIAMPEMDGSRLAERVLKLQPQTNVLLISGHYEGPPDRARVRFLKKPFFPSQLLEHLRELLPQD
jgi:two-component system cell cycle sensor histidine kinase/response regulator CckA